jgi:SAM-dependent methyltransferase
MSQNQWTAVDRYITDLFVPPDLALDAALQATTDAGMPLINVAPNQGKLLHILALAHGARNILEVGTLAGYSTIWLARALRAGGRLVTLEVDPKHAEVARANIARAGLADSVDLRLGRALDTLPQLVAEGAGPFDLVFIDALMIKIRDGVVANRPVYLAIGIDCEGAKQVLGLWVGPTSGESAKFWLTVLSELKFRGVADVCIGCCDGLTGLPDAITVTWPQAVVQLCVVHYADLRVMPTWPMVPLVVAA